MKLEVIFLLFMIYSFIGWAMEIVVCSLLKGKLVDRGFLIGPYCPIYGCGALVITLFLTRYHYDLLVLFVMSCVFGAVLEYFASYLMEKIFGTRWWDYSNKKYNLNGRISLETTVWFGFLGILLIKVFNPFFINVLSKFSDFALHVVSIVIALIFVLDLIVSFNIISKIKKIDLKQSKDSTEEVTKMVRLALSKESVFYRRLLSAFPNFKVEVRKNIEKVKSKYKS